MTLPAPFRMEISRHIWETRYRAAEEPDVHATWQRVAQAIAVAEAGEHAQWAERFYGLLDGFRFLPGGRILAGAGTGHRVTLFNCFVMGEIADDLVKAYLARRALDVVGRRFVGVLALVDVGSPRRGEPQ